VSLIKIGSRHVFVDESGDPNLQTGLAGASEYFVLTAVIVSTEAVPDGEAKVREIINRFFPKGELKSSRIGNKRKRRKQILETFAHVKFKHYSLVIDKSEIFSKSALRFRRTFVKFINRSLYSRLVESFTQIHVIADAHGKSDFMTGFGDYLERRLPRGLFETSSFQFADSRSHPFIQVADVLAGTILRAYSAQDPLDILEPVRSQTILIDEWPPRLPFAGLISDLPEDERLNHIIRTNAVRNAVSFIEENSPPRDSETAAQVAAIQYMLYHFRSIDPEEYLTTRRVHRHLEELGFGLPLRAVRERVIGRLRDHGVVIASGRSGIKLPYSVGDLHAFSEMVGSIVVPYLKRLQKARKQFLLATEGKLDIVAPERQPDLNSFLEGT
jgi:hypothetical protein